MLVKRRTNNRHNELHSMMLNFIEQIQSIANLFITYLTFFSKVQTRYPKYILVVLKSFKRLGSYFIKK